MTKATQSGRLNPVPKCSIFIPGAGTIALNNLPDISDSKSAVYNNEGIIGRSFPLYTYSHSADRQLNIQLHFFVIDPSDADKNLTDLRKIQSAVYPRQGDGCAPYKPPPVCRIRCGDLLGIGGICAILQSYSVRFPTEVAWYEKTNYCPYRFDVDTSWLVVYSSESLPYQNQIVAFGR